LVDQSKPSPSASIRLPAGLAALRERNFVLYVIGQFTSRLGDWIELTAVSWIIYEMTNSPFLLGLVGLFRATPTILLALFGGAIADRVPRKKVLLAVTAFVASAATVGFVFVTGDRYLLGGVLFLVANVTFGSARVVYDSFLPQIAGTEERDTISSRGWGFGYLGGGLLLALFVVAEWRAGREAMMPLGFFRSRVFAGANALTLLLYFALGGALFFIPFGLIRLGGYSTTGAGAALLPFALVMGAGSSFAGALADRWGARLSLTIGPIIAGAGFALLGFANLGASYWTGVLPALAVMSIGMTITVAPLTTTVIGAVGEEHAGVASGVNNAVARVAGLLAVAILGVVLFRAFAGALPDLSRARAAQALSALMAGEGDGPAGATEAFARAFRMVMWIAGACAAGGGIIGGLLIGRRPAKR